MIYFNNAASSYPKPDEVATAVEKAMNLFPVHASRASFSLKIPDIVNQTRKSIAKLFNVENPDNIIFTSGATESLNYVIRGIEVENSHIITTVTEHNSVLRPLYYVEKTEITYLSCDENGYVEPEMFQKNIKEKTKFFIINHSSNVTGIVQNIEKIYEIALENDILLIIDCAQSAGNVEINIEKFRKAIFIFTGHKSLFGISGTGGFYLPEHIELKPLKTGGTGIKSNVLHQPEGRPIFYESGTPNIVGLAALKAGVDFILENGIQKIIKRKKDIYNRILSEIKNNDKIKILNPTENNTGIISITVDDDIDEVCWGIERNYELILRTGLHCCPLIHKDISTFPAGTIRISPGFFNTDKEVETLIEAINGGFL
ncbi:MAG: aminotransferase class V-fold PLP-dependent enzyme [Candidatus Muiribacteriota bacterium]